MSPELDKLLCEKYPEMFVNRYLPASKSALCWGFECGDGWFTLLDVLCGTIDNHIRNVDHQIQWASKWNETAEPDQIRKIPDKIEFAITQIKEKFGTLRFYYNGGDDEIHGMVLLAGHMSGHICEQCGSPARLDSDGGWVRTLCDEHK